MNREGIENIKGALEIISKQCKRHFRVKIVLYMIAARVLMICLSVFLGIDFRRWFR